jgi:hypothetical protein
MTVGLPSPYDLRSRVQSQVLHQEPALRISIRRSITAGRSAAARARVVALLLAAAATLGNASAVDPGVVAADNAFGLKLFDNLFEAGTTNIAVSPLSVALALQIVYNGAAGSTRQAMAQTLQLPNQDVDAEPCSRRPEGRRADRRAQVAQ